MTALFCVVVHLLLNNHGSELLDLLNERAVALERLGETNRPRSRPHIWLPAQVIITIVNMIGVGEANEPRSSGYTLGHPMWAPWV